PSPYPKRARDQVHSLGFRQPIHHDRLAEAEGTDGRGEGVYTGIVLAGIIFVRPDRIDRAHFDLHRDLLSSNDVPESLYPSNSRSRRQMTKKATGGVAWGAAPLGPSSTALQKTKGARYSHLGRPHGKGELIVNSDLSELGPIANGDITAMIAKKAFRFMSTPCLCQFANHGQEWQSLPRRSPSAVFSPVRCPTLASSLLKGTKFPCHSDGKANGVAPHSYPNDEETYDVVKRPRTTLDGTGSAAISAAWPA